MPSIIQEYIHQRLFFLKALLKNDYDDHLMGHHLIESSEIQYLIDGYENELTTMVIGNKWKPTPVEAPATSPKVFQPKPEPKPIPKSPATKPPLNVVHRGGRQKMYDYPLLAEKVYRDIQGQNQVTIRVIVPLLEKYMKELYPEFTSGVYQVTTIIIKYLIDNQLLLLVVRGRGRTMSVYQVLTKITHDKPKPKIAPNFFSVSPEDQLRMDKLKEANNGIERINS